MAKKKQPLVEPPGKDGKEHYTEYGQTNQERIVDQTSRSESARHRCKGPKCEDAFNKAVGAFRK